MDFLTPAAASEVRRASLIKNCLKCGVQQKVRLLLFWCGELRPALQSGVRHPPLPALGEPAGLALLPAGGGDGAAAARARPRPRPRAAAEACVLVPRQGAAVEGAAGETAYSNSFAIQRVSAGLSKSEVGRTFTLFSWMCGRMPGGGVKRVAELCSAVPAHGADPAHAAGAGPRPARSPTRHPLVWRPLHTGSDCAAPDPTLSFELYCSLIFIKCDDTSAPSCVLCGELASSTEPKMTKDRTHIDVRIEFVVRIIEEVATETRQGQNFIAISPQTDGQFDTESVFDIHFILSTDKFYCVKISWCMYLPKYVLL